MPERVKSLNYRQHYSGDCSMAVIANMYHLATGKDIGEQAVVDKAVREGLGSTTTGMNPGGRVQLMRELGMDVRTLNNANVSDLAREVSSGRVVNVGVNSSILRDNSTQGGGELGHVINVVGVKTSAGGKVEGFYVVDTGAWKPEVRLVFTPVMAAATNNNTVIQSAAVQS